MSMGDRHIAVATYNGEDLLFLVRYPIAQRQYLHLHLDELESGLGDELRVRLEPETIAATLDDARFRYTFRNEPQFQQRCRSCKHCSELQYCGTESSGLCVLLNIAIADTCRSRCPRYAS